MEKRKFYTQFDPAEIINKDKQFDRHDNVDRISYVDNTTMVRRFVLEGKNLAAARAQALRSGSYSGDLKEIAEDDGYAVPVYPQDAAIAHAMIEQMEQKLETSVSAKAKEARSNDAAAADSEVTASSPSSEDK